MLGRVVGSITCSSQESGVGVGRTRVCMPVLAVVFHSQRHMQVAGPWCGGVAGTCACRSNGRPASLPACLLRPAPLRALQPMKHWYKPLAFYAAMEAAALLCGVALQAAGFQRHVWMGLAYFTRNMPAPQIRPSTDLPAGFYRSGSGMHVHQSARAAARAHSNSRSSSQQVPLVLVHGIGMGLVPYISMLFNMAATGGRGRTRGRRLGRGR